jgi:hypothetical protein
MYGMSYCRVTLCGMDTPPRASDLLATPVRTDADVLARISAIIDAEARAVPALWLFFLGHDGLQNNVVVPVDDIPEFPDPRSRDVAPPP